MVSETFALIARFSCLQLKCSITYRAFKLRFNRAASKGINLFIKQSISVTSAFLLYLNFFCNSKLRKNDG